MKKSQLTQVVHDYAMALMPENQPALSRGKGGAQRNSVNGLDELIAEMNDGPVPTDPLEALDHYQSGLDLQKRRELFAAIEATEAKFIEHGLEAAVKFGWSAAALKMLGVPESVLKRAGFSKPRSPNVPTELDLQRHQRQLVNAEVEPDDTVSIAAVATTAA